MKCRRPLYHRSGEQDDGTRRCGEVMRRGTHNGGVCMALLVPGFVQHLKLILYYTIALKDESRCCTARCQDGGVIRMAALSLRGDNPPSSSSTPAHACPSAILFPPRRCLSCSARWIAVGSSVGRHAQPLPGANRPRPNQLSS